jgi:putative oxidoreductase
MKIATIIIRVLIGLLLTSAAVMVLFHLAPEPVLSGDVKLFTEGMAASHYMMTLLKVTELICGIAFITGFFVPLATVVIFPITLNILLFHVFLAPEGLFVAIFLMLGNLFLAYVHRDKYKSVFSLK